MGNLSVDDRARRGVEKVASKALILEVRLSMLEQQIRVLTQLLGVDNDDSEE